MLNGLDLFSGIGGITLGLNQWIRPRYYCEFDTYAQGVLISRMSSGDLPIAPIWDDVRTLKGEFIELPIDIIYGGFPCQDISVAGTGKGLAGERSGLFYEIIRLTKEIQPSFVFLENVPAIRTRGLDQVIKEFTELGYDCRWTVVSAKEVGAHHLRKRWFMLAYNNRFKRGHEWKNEVPNNGEVDQRKTFTSDHGKTQPMANTNGERLERFSETKGQGESRRFKADNASVPSRQYWAIEPNVGRVVNGLPFRVDRIKGLGNAVVPLQAQVAFKKLMGLT